jgi:hypothetical protein
MIGEDLDSGSDHEKKKKEIQPVTDSEPGGKSVGHGLGKRSGSWIGGNELLDFRQGSQEASSEYGESCAHDPQRDKSEEDLPGGEPEGAHPDLGEVGHFLFNSTGKLLQIDLVISRSGQFIGKGVLHGRGKNGSCPG